MFSVLGQLYEELFPTKTSPIPSIKEFREFFPKQAPTREIDFLTSRELERIYVQLKSCRSRAILPFIKFLASTGLRRSEALELKWSDVDFESGFVKVRKSKNGSARKAPLEKDSIDTLSFTLVLRAISFRIVQVRGTTLIHF